MIAYNHLNELWVSNGLTIKSSTFLLWPIWLFIVVDMVFFVWPMWFVADTYSPHYSDSDLNSTPNPWRLT